MSGEEPGPRAGLGEKGAESAESSPLAGQSDYSGESEADDETTMAEAEAGAAEDDGELADLEAEQDIPIEELMRRYYGAAPPEEEAEPSPDPKEAASAQPPPKTPALEPAEEPAQPSAAEPAVPHSNGFDRRGPVEVPNPHGYFAAYSDESEGEDADYQPPEFWKKEIRIGQDFQAEVPDFVPSEQRNGTGDADEARLGSLLWSPWALSEEKVEAYLRAVYTLLMAKGAAGGEAPAGVAVPRPSSEAAEASAAEVRALEAELGLAPEGPPAKRLRTAAQPLPPTPNGCLRDDEDALLLLLRHGHRPAAALAEEEVLEQSRFRHSLGRSPDLRLEALRGGAVGRPGAWSEAEAAAFEEGLRRHGKVFPLIAREAGLSARSLGDLVEFYYAWKKSERHDVFAARHRVLKRHYHLHPDASDYMEHLLETVDGPEQPPTTTAAQAPFSPPPSHHIVLGGTAFAKAPLLSPTHAHSHTTSLPVIDSHTVQQLLPE